MSTTIIRAAASSDNFSILPHKIIRETRLSYRARGVLIRLLSNAEGFSMSADDLSDESPDGRDAIRSALRELREVGYLKTEKMQDARGRWTTRNVIYDVPTSRELENRRLENRRLENRTSVNRPSDFRQSVSQALKEEVPVEVTGEVLKESSVEKPKNKKSLVDLKIDDIFSRWKLVMNHQVAKLDSARKKIIAARLRDGYSSEELKLAIDGCKLSPFHMGQNDQSVVYDGIEVIFKSGGNVDKFIALATRPKPMGGSGSAGSSLSLSERAALMDWEDDDEIAA